MRWTFMIVLLVSIFTIEKSLSASVLGSNDIAHDIESINLILEPNDGTTEVNEKLNRLKSLNSPSDVPANDDDMNEISRKLKLVSKAMQSEQQHDQQSLERGFKTKKVSTPNTSKDNSFDNMMNQSTEDKLSGKWHTDDVKNSQNDVDKSDGPMLQDADAPTDSPSSAPDAKDCVDITDQTVRDQSASVVSNCKSGNDWQSGIKAMKIWFDMKKIKVCSSVYTITVSRCQKAIDASSGDSSKSSNPTPAPTQEPKSKTWDEKAQNPLADPPVNADIPINAKIVKLRTPSAVVGEFQVLENAAIRKFLSIGKFSPSESLDVVGNAIIAGNVLIQGGADSNINIKNTSSDVSMTLGTKGPMSYVETRSAKDRAWWTGTSLDSRFFITKINSDDSFTILDDGNVGINQLKPRGSLEVRAKIDKIASFIISSENRKTDYTYISVDGPRINMGVVTNSEDYGHLTIDMPRRIDFKGRGSTFFDRGNVIIQNGKLAVNTLEPRSAGHFIATEKVGDHYHAVAFGNSASNVGFLGAEDTYIYLANMSGNPFLFMDQKTGFIGVNIKSPKTQLDVGGDVNVSGSLRVKFGSSMKTWLTQNSSSTSLSNNPTNVADVLLNAIELGNDSSDTHSVDPMQVIHGLLEHIRKQDIRITKLENKVLRN